MKNTTCCSAIFLAGAVLFGNAAFAQGRFDFGQREYLSNCASCHGVSGKGDGAMRQHLVTAPSDLTTLKKRNGGVFPSNRIYETIDGRTSVAIGPHGAREMPIWGNVFQSDDETRRSDWCCYGRDRMSSLVDYLARIQEK